MEVAKDPRVWALFLIYGSCFGMELTIDNIAALYFADYFHLALTTAGFVAASFGMMNLFARALGGIVSDRFYRNWGLRGRVVLLGCTLLGEGLSLILFSQIRWLPLAIGSMMFAGLFVKMSNGATYSVVPFINPKAPWSSGGHCGSGRQRGGGARGVSVQDGKSYLAPGSAHLGRVRSADLFSDFCRKVSQCRRGIGTRGNRKANRCERHDRERGVRKLTMKATVILVLIVTGGSAFAQTLADANAPAPSPVPADASATPAQGGAPATTADVIKFGNVTVTGSLRSRLYVWNWFQPATGENQYQYLGDLMRLGFAETSRSRIGMPNSRSPS